MVPRRIKDLKPRPVAPAPLPAPAKQEAAVAASPSKAAAVPAPKALAAPAKGAHGAWALLLLALLCAGCSPRLWLLMGCCIHALLMLGAPGWAVQTAVL